MVIAEALGHALVVEPYVDTVVVAGGLLRRAGGPRPRRCWRRSCPVPRSWRWPRRSPESGERWQDVSTVAERDGDGGYCAAARSSR
jgi:hypothetical protein